MVAPDVAKDRDIMAAREGFERRVEEEFVGRQKRLLDDGSPRRAAERLDEGLRHCPWSAKLKSAKEETQGIIDAVDAFGRALKELNERSSGTDLTSHRAVLSQAPPWVRYLKDSPGIQQALVRAASTVVKVWAATVNDLTDTAIDERQLKHDMTLAGASREDHEHLVNQVRLSSALAGGQQRLAGDASSQTNVLALLDGASLDRRPPYVKPLREACRRRLIRATVVAVDREFLGAGATSTATDFVERVLDVVNDEPQILNELVARVHADRARHLAGSGRAAAVALLHLERARGLAAPVATRDDDVIRATAGASFAAAGRLPVKIQIDTNPADEPILQDIVRQAVTESAIRHSRRHAHIQLVSPPKTRGDIHILLESITAFRPSESDLSRVSSTYLSHYENVPNPAKKMLKSQLDMQKISVDFAESSLRSSISSHNISRTEWSLASVNSARTRYNFEIDSYNALVQRYNSEPTTVSRPVYLPYSFREGTVRHGWRLSGKVIAGNREEKFLAEDIDSDFVRLGSRTDDREVRYRRDDYLDIPVGVDRLLEQLRKVADRVVQSMGRAVDAYEFDVRPELGPTERRLLSELLHPFKSPGESGAQAPGWARTLVSTDLLPNISEPSVPTTRLAKPRHVKSGPPDAMANFYGSAVAWIHDGKGVQGSGGLISPDGLILTAAHVLLSDRIEVIFPAVSLEQRHRAELVFVNERHDVALIRVSGYRADRWFEIALEEIPARGEPIVAFGSPAIGHAGTAVNAVSAGIVAKPYEKSEAAGVEQQLVADITVASGSSGGPLISQRTGKIIGVVTAVVSPTISKDFAASGYWAVAAPGNELQKWLGIMYGQ